MGMWRITIAGVLLSVPIAATADPLAPSPAPTPVAAVRPAKDANPQICRTIEEMGSLIRSRRICATAAEWKERDFRAGQWTEHMSSTRWLNGGG